MVDIRKMTKRASVGLLAGVTLLAGCTSAPSADHVLEKYDELDMNNYRVEATMTASVLDLEAAVSYPTTATFIGEYTENNFRESILGTVDEAETYGEKTEDGFSLYRYADHEWIHTVGEEFEYAFNTLDVTGEGTEKEGDTITMLMSSDELMELPEMDVFNSVLEELYKYADQADVRELIRGRQVKADFDAKTYTLKSIDMPDITGTLDTADGEEKGADVTISFHAEIKEVGNVAEEDAKVPESVLENFYGEAKSDDPALDENGHEIKTDIEINEDEGFYGSYNGHNFSFDKPVPWSAFAEDGWKFTEYNPGDVGFCSIENEKYPDVRMFVYGQDGEIVRTEDIENNGVYQYEFYSFADDAVLPPFTWLNGIGVDCTPEELMEVYGEPTQNSEYVGLDNAQMQRIEYNPIDHLYLTFHFKNGKLYWVDMSNYINTWYI